MTKPLLIFALCGLQVSCTVYSSSGRKDFESKSSTVSLNSSQIKDCFYNQELKKYFRWVQEHDAFEPCENNNME